MKTLFLGIALFFASAALYAEECAEQFYKGLSPSLTSSRFNNRSTKLCFEQYAVLYSGITKTPIWSAEFLTNNRIKEAKKLKRQDSFHEEDRLPVADRSFLKDYKGSGRLKIDRGHIAPNSDFSTYSAQFEAFSLANIVPQSSNSNQGVWADIEIATRKLVTQRERLYVVTGPIFDNTDQKLNNRVTIPTRVFKAIYDPVRREAAAYVVRNEPGTEYETVSISELEHQIGVNVFPALDSDIKAKKMRLPEPATFDKHHRHDSRNDELNVKDVGSALLEKSLKYLFK